MDLREDMSVRRAYNVVRQKVESDKRLTFEEFAILCRLSMADTTLKTSAIAEYQSALRPTMTHRTNHLSGLGFIERGEGDTDRRNVVCGPHQDPDSHRQGALEDLGREDLQVRRCHGVHFLQGGRPGSFGPLLCGGR